jgi:hypothetical protein
MPGPLDEIVLFPIRQREGHDLKIHQRRLAEIRSIRQRLKACCGQTQFRWPNKGDLEHLDFLVLELFRRIRKGLPAPRWKCYKAVDDHWHLGLWKTLSDLVDRAASNTPPRPLEEYDRRLTRTPLSEVTKKFFHYYDEVVKGRDPSQIEWEQFDDLFRSLRGQRVSSTVPLTSRLGECGGKPRLVAYTVFLELFCSDLQWARKHWKGAKILTLWVVINLQHPQMVRKLIRFLIPSDIGSLFIEDTDDLPKRFAEEKKKARQARDRDRKRRKK